MRRVDSRSVRLLLSLGIVLGLGATLTHARFTTSVAVTGTTITVGSADLQVQNANTVTNYGALNQATMSAGESTAGLLTVKNNGSLALNYYADAVATDPDGKGLASALQVRVTGDGSTTGQPPHRTCANAALTGTASAFTSGFIGSSASPRQIAPGASENFCIEASLPSTAPMSLHAASTAVTFTFRAATVMSTPWTDTVPVSGTSLGTVTIQVPVMSCGGQQIKQSVVNWTKAQGNNGYRLNYGIGGVNELSIAKNVETHTFQAPASGITWVRALYGNYWISGPSNSLTYMADNLTTAICG